MKTTLPRQYFRDKHRAWLARNPDKNKENCKAYYQKLKSTKSKEELRAGWREAGAKQRAKKKLLKQNNDNTTA